MIYANRKYTEVELFKNLKYTNPRLVVCSLDDFSKDEDIRGYLQSACRKKLKELKTLENYEARVLFFSFNILW